MFFLLSNWILFFPIAGGLAAVLAMSGDVTQRPQNDFLRTAVRILIWQLLLLGFVGVVFRLTPLHILWIFVVVTFAVRALLWERQLARHTLMLVLLSTEGVPRRIEGVTHYLHTEGRGIWRRLGLKLRQLLHTSKDWAVAVERSRLVRDARSLQALAIFRMYGRSDVLRREMAVASNQRMVVSQLLGRLLSASLSLAFIPLVSSSIFLSTPASPARLIQAISSEFSTSETYYFDLWTDINGRWWIDVWLPLLIWAVLVGLIVFRLVPVLTRVTPLSFLFRSYYRALSLRGLAEISTVEPQAAAACRASSQATPVASWSRRFARAAQRIDAGESVNNALYKARLLNRREASTLGLATNHQSFSWTLREISEAAMQRTFDRASALTQIAVVVIVLTAGVFVCLAAVGVISTLAQWVTDLV